MHEFDKCLLFAKSGEKLAEGFVQEYSGSVMKVYIHSNSGAIVPMEDVYAFVYNSVRGECKYEGTVSRASLNMAVLKDVALIYEKQKRDNTRVNKQMKYTITSIFKDDQRVRLEKPVDITILNISAQGLYFNCGVKFERGLQFPLVFKETRRPVSLVIEIIRREDYDRSYNYGCRFVGISEKDMDEIYRFVLREQILQRRRALML